MVEQWKAVPGYEGLYEVSDLGRVRGLDRVVGHKGGGTRIAPGGIRRLSSDVEGGRKDVMLSKGGRARHFRVAALVLAAFIGPRPNGLEACHSNGDCSDDRLANLYWGTRSQNMLDTVRHGRHASTQRDTCPRGHKLVAPNLVESRTAQGHRVCKACTWARASNQRAQKRGETYDLPSGADQHFERIMMSTENFVAS